MLLHYHPLELYRHQVIKQTDVVLATYLVEHNFSEEETRRTFDYYDPLSTGDSTLSACVQSIVASAVGYTEPALRYFTAACTVDLLDTHGNTADGIHVASCGGTWLALVASFGALRDFDGELRFHPRLPREWDGLRLPRPGGRAAPGSRHDPRGDDLSPPGGPRAPDPPFRAAKPSAASW